MQTDSGTDTNYSSLEYHSSTMPGICLNFCEFGPLFFSWLSKHYEDFIALRPFFLFFSFLFFKYKHSSKMQMLPIRFDCFWSSSRSNHPYKYVCSPRSPKSDQHSGKLNPRG